MRISEMEHHATNTCTSLPTNSPKNKFEQNWTYSSEDGKSDPLMNINEICTKNIRNHVLIMGVPNLSKTTFTVTDLCLQASVPHGYRHTYTHIHISMTALIPCQWQGTKNKLLKMYCEPL